MKVFFWLFMLVMALLVPGTMMFFGNEFLRRPGAVNSGYGYRTKRSMVSQEAWDFAHRTCGRLWKRMGRWMLGLSVPAMLLSLPLSIEGIGMWGLGIVVLQTAAMIATIFPVERALKENFDQFGHRIRNNTNGNEE